MLALGIVLAHLVGDYLLQSHWMATEKTKRWWPAVAHGVTYALPYTLVTQSPVALLLIAATHVVIDRYRLARYVVWLKNQLGPRQARPALTATGYPADTPAWLAVWLMIVADNTLHLLINTAAVVWL
jgi:hypothetical protein